jgi:hypothetical protein
MLKKSSVFMMVLLVVIAASLIGIASIYLYAEGQRPPAAKLQPKQPTIYFFQGNVKGVDISVYPDGKACIADVQIAGNTRNNYSIKPDGTVDLLSPDASVCNLFGQSMIGKRILNFQTERLTTPNALPAALRDVIEQAYLYKVIRTTMG